MSLVRVRHGLLAAGLLAGLLSGLPAEAAAGTEATAVIVTPIALPSPVDIAFAGSQATDVNEAGVIVGWAPGQSGTAYASHAVRWQNGAVTDLDPFATSSVATAVDLAGDVGIQVGGSQAYVRVGTTVTSVAPAGAVTSKVIDLNERGDALVAWKDATETSTGYRLSVWRRGTFTEVTPAGEEAAGTSGGDPRGYLNTLGQVAALFRNRSTGATQARIWAAGRFTPIGTAVTSVAALNELGVVVGTRTDANGLSQAFTWQGGRLTTLPGGAGGGSASAVNQLGQVVGAIKNADGTSHAALWNGGKLTDLGTLGGPNSSASGINDRGQVTGSSMGTQPSQFFYHAFVWWRGTFTDLSSPSVTSSSAGKITDTGYVIGSKTQFVGNKGDTTAAAWRIS